MDSSGFSSPRTDCFPAGLRVLVVDDDPTWLKILEKMLKKCNYEVTTCNLAREALDLLRERKDGFDIVISDVNMPDMDGFKLLERVGLEMDLPVIMMSVDGETSRVMKGVQHGACDYLLKPIRMKELRNIWQHVFRKRIHEVRDIEGHESLEEMQIMRSVRELSDDSYLFSGDLISGKKRKDAENKHDDRACGDSASGKKVRVVWTFDLHQKFVKAVNQIGFEKVGPKKILDLMGVPWLTRENVASHLQKYRLYLSRLQKENELKATFGGNVCLQSPITKNATTTQQNIPADEDSAVSGNKVPVHHAEQKICEGNAEGTLPVLMTEPKRAAVLGDLNDLDVKCETKIPVHYSWSIPPLLLTQEHKPHFPLNRFDHLPMPVHHIHDDPVETGLAHDPVTARKEMDEPTQAGLKPSYSNTTSSQEDIQKVTKVETTADLFSVQPESHSTDYHAADPIPSSSVWNTKNHSLDRNPLDDLGFLQKNLTAGNGSAIRFWDEEFIDYSSQGDFYPPNAYLGSLDPLGYGYQELIADFPPHLYDPLKFDSEFQSDTVEYPVIEQGVYIA